MTITSDDIQDLIKFGNADKLNVELLDTFNHRDHINQQACETWQKLIIDISDAETISIYKALINIERELKWIGGSVAGAIWVYQIIRQRRLDDNYKLADFGLKHCENPWIPFGGSYFGKRTIKDYFAYQGEKSRRKAMNAERYSRVLDRVVGRKDKRANAIAELRKLTFEQRGLICIKLNETYKAASTQQRLEVIAADEKYPPEYYPVNWIKLKPEEIKLLPIDLVKKLYDKLSTKTKGDWKRFAFELQKLDDGL